MHEGWGADFVRAAYRRWMQEGEETGDEPNLSSSLRDIGQDPGRVLKLANSRETNDLLRAETETAQQLGIFRFADFRRRPRAVLGRRRGWKTRSAGANTVPLDDRNPSVDGRRSGSNEAAIIVAALQALAPLRARGAEIIVADGGSRDGTRGSPSRSPTASSPCRAAAARR